MKERSNKGGRPKSLNPKKYRIDVPCDRLQYLAIQSKAEETGKSTAEYVRDCALNKVITPALTQEETEAYLLLRKYGTHFVQISNLVKNKDPRLFCQIRELVEMFKQELKFIRYGK